MRQVEANVHHAHHHTLTREGLRQIAPLIGRMSIQTIGHRVAQSLTHGTGFQTLHPFVGRQWPQLRQWNLCHTYIPHLSQHTTAIALHHLTGIAIQSDEGTNRPLIIPHRKAVTMMALSVSPTGARRCLPCQLPQPRRHLAHAMLPSHSSQCPYIY